MNRRKRKRGGAPTFFLLLLVLSGFAGVLWANSTPVEPMAPVLPTAAEPTVDTERSLTDLLTGNFGQNVTALPTPMLPDQAARAPEQVQPGAADAAASPVNAADIAGTPILAAPLIITPTPPPSPVLTAQPGNEAAVVANVTREAADWNPPLLVPPLSRDPLGLDTYWLQRPVDSNANNAVLNYYPYGSDGSDAANPERVHHGVDMPNPVGERVSAAADGVVTWAADGRQDTVSSFQNSPSYGNVIVIRHNFAYDGRPVYTLYAHLSASFVEAGQEVKMGQAIGQVGNSGRVSGPHVHFEVRLGEDPRIEDHSYASTYNPVLWMASYVGHGVIAGRIVDENGNPIDDADITIRNWATGLVERTTSSYVFPGTSFDVQGHPAYDENFAVADIPVGRYDIIAQIYGQRVIQQVVVSEGATAFVELSPPVADDE